MLALCSPSWIEGRWHNARSGSAAVGGLALRWRSRAKAFAEGFRKPSLKQVVKAFSGQVAPTLRENGEAEAEPEGFAKVAKG